MQIAAKLRLVIAIFFIATCTQISIAQTKADVFDPGKPVTWLGLDFSLTKFIVEPKGDIGNNAGVTNDTFRQIYTYQWNKLFIDEQPKYDVAKAISRPSVKYAIDVTIKANKTLYDRNLLSENPGDFHIKTEADIADAVKNYDFQDNEGIGMMFFVEGMSKATSLLGLWITFVDVKSKTVLLTEYRTEKPGGFGFRNYWAKPYAVIIKNMQSDFKKMNK